MKQTRRKKPSSAEFLEQGNEAFRAGRIYLAAEAFEKARSIDPQNPAILFNLASVRERLAEMDSAAALLTQTLRRRPAWPEAAHRLASLLGRFKVQAAGDLEPHGLLAAFSFNTVDQSSLAGAAFDYLAHHTALGSAISKAGEGQALEAARDLIAKRTDKALSEPLFIAALSAAPNRNPATEKLLAAMRHVIFMELPEDRFEDKALTGLVIGLIRQCLANEFIWPVSDAEAGRLAETSIDPSALADGDSRQSRQLMLGLLYKRPDQLMKEALSAEGKRAIRPRALGDLLASWWDNQKRRQELTSDIPSLGAIEDHTSQKVAGQYEAHPYPQWTSIHLPAEGSAASGLARFFQAERLGFMDAPFKVLIAGCGTGQQAIAAARRYGPNAQVTAIDLSRASLAYARAKADDYEIGNLRFAQADILALPDNFGPFDVIEAVGVLHHMAEPFKGWQSLLSCLRPGGLILTGLYSAAARTNIASLRSEDGYPGPECDDDAARRYRLSLMEREDEAASLLQLSHDFYTQSEFRDLVLHEHERPILLAEIEAFLQQNGLTFKGFQLPALLHSTFQKAYPGDEWPGTLSHWAEFENQHLNVFEAMYRLWCEKSE